MVPTKSKVRITLLEKLKRTRRVKTEYQYIVEFVPYSPDRDTIPHHKKFDNRNDALFQALSWSVMNDDAEITERGYYFDDPPRHYRASDFPRDDPVLLRVRQLMP